MPERGARAAWWLASAWLGVMLVGTSLPGSLLPREDYGIDDVVHFGMYGTLALLLLRAARRSGLPARRAWLLLAAVCAFGAFDELHQLFIPGRDASVLDWAADTLGAATGLWAGAIILKSKRHAWLD